MPNRDDLIFCASNLIHAPLGKKLAARPPVQVGRQLGSAIRQLIALASERDSSRDLIRNQEDLPIRTLHGQTAIVLGASGQIGIACARALARDGAAVLLMSRRLERLEAARSSIARDVPDARVELFAGDALLSSDLQRAALAAFEIQGRLDIVIPTLGGTMPRPILMHEAETIRDDLALNLGSAILAVRHTAPLLARGGGGSIVFISSEAAKLSMPWLSSYAASKAGLEAFVRSAADELASLRIRVNSVRPGTTRTEATQVLFDSPEMVGPLAAGRPLGRLGEPDDIAAGVRYLAGPESSWVTGQSIAIDGGGELRQAPDLRTLVENIYGKEDFAEVLAGRAPADGRSDERAGKGE